MIKKLIIPFFLLCITFVIFSCASNKVENQKNQTETEINSPQIEQQEQKADKKEEIVKEPEEPVNVKFAKQLRVFLDKGDIKAAISHFDNLPEELKDDLELKFILGALYYSDCQYEKAIEIAYDILEIDPDNIDALELVTLSKHAMGDKAAFNEGANKILAVDPYNPTVNIQKAEEYALAKKYKLAKDSYRKALKGNPENEDAMFGYAQMCFYTDDLKTAKTFLEKILDKNPNNPAALAYMGKIAYDEENYLRASKFFKQAIDNDSSNYDYWMDYGKSLRYQGKFEEAEKAWTYATQLDPSYFLCLPCWKL